MTLSTSTLSETKPLILLTCATTPHVGGLVRLDDIAGHNYSEGIVQAGGLPIVVGNLEPHLAPAYIDRVDGLVLAGGEDMDPKYFNQDPNPKLGKVTPIRDAFEVALYKAAKQKKIPILGICRGLQVINIVEGGTLHQHLGDVAGTMSHDQANNEGDGYHKVTLEPTTAFAKALGKRELYTNSFHHQAIDQLAPGFTVVGKTADGIIEAISNEGQRSTQTTQDTLPYIFATQWHPEMNFDRDDDQKVIFAEFLKAVLANNKTAKNTVLQGTYV